MPNLYLPVLSYGYWGIEFSVGWGYGGAGFPITATVAHQGFNPTKSLPYPNDLRYSEERIFLYNSIDAPGIIFSMNMETMELDLEMFFKDPFLMLTMFNNKTITAGATWGDGNTGTIVGDFTVDTYKDSIMYQLHIDNPGASGEDEDKTFLGGEITKYMVSYEVGKLLMENVTIKFMNAVNGAQPFTTDADFDDGLFADWDDDAPYHATSCRVEWGGSAIVGIEIENAKLEIPLIKEQKHLAKSRNASINWDSLREATCTVEGYLSTKAQVTQVQKLHAAKTKQTLEFIYFNPGGAEERKWQFTYGYISDVQIDGIPEAGNPVKTKFVISQGVGSALSYSGKWLSHVDPYTTPKRIYTVDR